MSARRPDAGRPAAANDVDRLRRVLEALLDGHRTLRSCLDGKREAIRSADLEAITRLCSEEKTLAQRMQGLERQRRELVTRLVPGAAATADAPITAHDLGAVVGGSGGDALRTLAEALREEVHAVRRESAIVASAARALSRHVSGVMQSVNSLLSRVGVYERQGRIATGSQMDFCVDLKS